MIQVEKYFLGCEKPGRVQFVEDNVSSIAIVVSELGY